MLEGPAGSFRWGPRSLRRWRGGDGGATMAGATMAGATTTSRVRSGVNPDQLSIPVIAVALIEAAVERPVIDAWAREQEPRVSAVLDAAIGTGKGLGAALATYDDALVIPVRVAWQPSVERQPTTSRLAELALLATPKRPATWLSRQLAARVPGRR